MVEDAQVPIKNPAEPAWDVAHLFPAQGEWTEADYLALESNRLVELVNGRLEVPPNAYVAASAHRDVPLPDVIGVLGGAGAGRGAGCAATGVAAPTHLS